MTLNAAAGGRKPIQRDSFFDLTALMKAKKPYPPIPPPPSPRPSLSATTNDSAAVCLQEQARSPTLGPNPPVQEYRKEDMQRLESILREAEDLPIDDDDDNDNAILSHHALTESKATVEPLIPGFELSPIYPVRAESIVPPTPAESVNLSTSEEPVVRAAINFWDAMGRDQEVLKDEKQEMEGKNRKSKNSKQTAISQDGGYESMPRRTFSKLQHQSETNKDHKAKATVDQALPSNGMQSKGLQLELNSLENNLATTTKTAKVYAGVIPECSYLQTALQNNQTGNSNHITDLTNAKNCEIEILSKEADCRQCALRYSKIEHEVASIHADVEKYKTLAQNRLGQLNQREKLLCQTQERYAAEHTKVEELEDRLEDLQRKLTQVDDLQSTLREKSSECDHFRAKLKNQEKMIEEYRQRVLRASDNGAALRGAAHLVKPQSNTKLSTLVLGCSECYAKNITCDNRARCRYCTENNEKCARWRCSLKHILGICPDMPCRLPHDDSGWLLQADPRPQW